MAKSLNQVTLLGRLTVEPELKQTPNGQNVCSISLALNRSYKDSSDQWQEVTDFIDVVFWGNLAETASKYLKKGGRALISGRLSQRRWEQDGQKRSKVEVVASELTLIEARDGFSTNTDEDFNQQSADEEVTTTEVDDSPIDLKDLPF
jgi:single-strand DNA-binding protein